MVRRLNGKALAVLISVLLISLTGWWADSIILRYDPVFYIGFSAMATLSVLLFLGKIENRGFYRAVLFGSFLGYFIGLLSNIMLEFIFVTAITLFECLRDIPMEINTK